MGRLGAVFGRLEAVLGRLGLFGAVLGSFLAVLRLSWAVLGCFWASSCLFLVLVLCLFCFLLLSPRAPTALLLRASRSCANQVYVGGPWGAKTF